MYIQTNRKTFPALQGARVDRTPHLQVLGTIPGGVSGIEKTLQYMEGFVDQYKTNPTIFLLARRLVQGLDQKDYAGEVREIFNYVKNRVRYVHDVNGVETLQTPVKTLEIGQGDCDDKSSLLAALLQSIGFQTVFHALGVNGGRLCHVLVHVKMPAGNWICLDTTENRPLGWSPQNVTISRFSNNSMQLDGFFSSAFHAVTNVVKKAASGAKQIAKGTVNTTVKAPTKLAVNLAKGKSVKKSLQTAASDVKSGVVEQYHGGVDVARAANDLRKTIRAVSTPPALLKVENKAVDAVAKVLTSKQFQIVAMIMEFFPLTAPFALALQLMQVGSLVAGAEAMRKQISTMTAEQKKAFNQLATAQTYVYDPKLQALRKKKPKGDDGLATYQYNAALEKFELTSAGSTIAQDDGSSVAPSSAPVSYAGGGGGGGGDGGDPFSDQGYSAPGDSGTAAPGNAGASATAAAAAPAKSSLPFWLTAGSLLISAF